MKKTYLAVVLLTSLSLVSCHKGGGGSSNDEPSFDKEEEKQENSSLKDEVESGYAPSSLAGKTLEFVNGNSFNGFKSFQFIGNTVVIDNNGVKGNYSYTKLYMNEGKLSINIQSEGYSFVTTNTILSFESKYRLLFKGDVRVSNSNTKLTINAVIVQ